MSEETSNPEWARKTHQNLVRVLGGLTTLGFDPAFPGDPDALVSEARVACAVRAICGKSIDEVTAWLSERLPAGRKPTRRELLEAAVCLRWNCSPTALRKIVAGPTARSRRRANRQQNPKFFEDLHEFGAVRFKRDGSVVQDSLNRGPGPVEYFDSVEPGGDRLAAVV
jgi:hypothetical protein